MNIQNNRDDNKILEIYNEFTEITKGFITNGEISSENIRSFTHYMGNLITTIIKNNKYKELRNESINIFVQIKKIFKNDKNLIIEFLKFLKDRYDKKELKYKNVLEKALEEFNKRQIMKNTLGYIEEKARKYGNDYEVSQLMGYLNNLAGGILLLLGDDDKEIKERIELVEKVNEMLNNNPEGFKIFFKKVQEFYNVIYDCKDAIKKALKSVKK